VQEFSKILIVNLKNADFTKFLLKWHTAENTREMPWKGEKDPYKIWLSEIILQQTRVEQGWAYYEKFAAAFPTIVDLARAPEQKVFKLWEGLGYYSRCRNLITTAKKVDAEYGGKFPVHHAEILALKGIGPYTAAAIASFAYNLPHAVVDGNVLRVLSRYFGNSTPIDSSAGKKLFTELADALLDKRQAGIYNQAIMDFGAIVCKPQNPLCDSCIQRVGCQALQKGMVARLPVKEKSIRKRQRWFYYFLVETPGEKIYIRKRKEKDIWEDLYEFVLWEADEPLYLSDPEILGSEFVRQIFGRGSLTIRYVSRVYRQELSHQTIRGQFITVWLEAPLPLLGKEYELVDRRQLPEYAFPGFINAWLQDPTPIQSLF
jgi:A/G-specific adenine glycosylase